MTDRGSGVQLKEVAKRYSDIQAVDHIDLTIEPGEIFGLLRNGIDFRLI